MERESRKKSMARKKTNPSSQRAKRGGTSTNPGGASEEQMVKPFPTQIQFRHGEHRNKFQKMMGRKIVSNRYLHATSLIEIGLLEDINMYVHRMGWNEFILMQNPSYAIPTCEFLSSFEFNDRSLMLNFRLGNEEHALGLFELNDVFHFPKNQDANVAYDRHEFWREITGERGVFYEARSAKESRIRLPALKYLHRLMAHSLFPRKEGDSVVTTTELNVLHCMVHDRKLDVCHALAGKLRDVATKPTGAIKVGGIVTAIAKYLNFDIENMPFEKVQGRHFIDTSMMEAMGLVRIDHNGRAFLIQPEPQVEEEEAEEEGDASLNEVMERLDTLELQIGVIDANVGELNNEIAGIGRTSRHMNHTLNLINHNLNAYFSSQNYVPPPFQHDEEMEAQDSSSEEEDEE